MNQPWILGLPVRPKPHPNEGLAAYCWRLSTSNGLPLPPDFKVSTLANHEPPRHDSPFTRLLGLERAQQLWEREKQWWLRAPGHPPRWPRHCPRCAAETGIHYAALDLPFVTVCPIHGCRLTDRCPLCNHPLTWFRLGRGYVCKCGSDFTKAATEKATPAQSTTARLIAAAKDHTLVSPPNVPLSCFEYSAGDLYALLEWAYSVHSICRQPNPWTYLRSFTNKKPAEPLTADRLDAAATRLLCSLPDAILLKGRRLRRWACRSSEGPLVFWAHDPTVVAIIELRSIWASQDTPMSRAMTNAVNSAYRVLSDGPPELSRSCFHPRYSAPEIRRMQREFETWWAALSNEIPLLTAHSEFPRKASEEETTKEVRKDVASEVVSLLNLLLNAASHQLPLSQFLALRERWHLPPTLRPHLTSLGSVASYLISLRPSERAYFGDLLRFCITGTPDEKRITTRFDDLIF